MSDLTDFITARLNDDERIAQDATGNNWHWKEGEDGNDSDDQGPWLMSDHVHHFTDSRGTARSYPESVTSTWITGAWGGLNIDDTDKAHIARHDPAHVLRDIESKRAIVAAYMASGMEFSLHMAAGAPTQARFGAMHALEGACRTLAAVYADHPDYQEAWKPNVDVYLA